MKEQIEIHKDYITGKVEIKKFKIGEIAIKIERDSVCFGDDTTAPHYIQVFLNKDDLLSHLFKEILDNGFLSKITNAVWDICYNNKVLGQIYFDKNLKGTYKLFVEDESISSYNNAIIYCKNAKIKTTKCY